MKISIINYVLEPSNVFWGQMFSIVVRRQDGAWPWEKRAGKVYERGLLWFCNVLGFCLFCFGYCLCMYMFTLLIWVPLDVYYIWIYSLHWNRVEKASTAMTTTQVVISLRMLWVLCVVAFYNSSSQPLHLWIPQPIVGTYLISYFS